LCAIDETLRTAVDLHIHLVQGLGDVERSAQPRGSASEGAAENVEGPAADLMRSPLHQQPDPDALPETLDETMALVFHLFTGGIADKEPDALDRFIARVESGQRRPTTELGKQLVRRQTEVAERGRAARRPIE